LLQYIKFSIRSPRSDQKCTSATRRSLERASTNVVSSQPEHYSFKWDKREDEDRGFLRLFDGEAEM